MEPRKLIKLLRMVADEPHELLLLKSQYNRYASQLNITRSEEWTQENDALSIELKSIKKKIDNYTID